MNDKFKNIKTDEDTRIIFRKEIKINGLEAVHEKWNWDGIIAESLIFVSVEVKEINEEMFQLILGANHYFSESSQITLKRLDEFTFVNFNFQT